MTVKIIRKQFFLLRKIELFLNQIVKQVTLLVDNVKIRIDFLGFDPLTNMYYLGEAKFTTKNKNWSTDWLSASTKTSKNGISSFSRW